MAFAECESISVTDADIVCATEMKIVTKPADKFYSDAAEYWSEVPPTVDGMLGGFGSISLIDIQGSKGLLKYLFQTKQPPGRKMALDCGAGIGRISKNLLINLFDKVDLVEQNPTFLEQAKVYLGPRLAHKIGQFYPVGLQNFVPETNKYDVIWMQWVLGHLTDAHLVRFLTDCKKGLGPNGVIVVKENVTSGEVEVDVTDSSVTRPYLHFMNIFSKAGLYCHKTMKQSHFPKALYTVYMFALRPTQDDPNDTSQMEIDTENSEISKDSVSERQTHGPSTMNGQV